MRVLSPTSAPSRRAGHATVLLSFVLMYARFISIGVHVAVLPPKVREHELESIRKWIAAFDDAYKTEQLKSWGDEL